MSRRFNIEGITKKQKDSAFSLRLVFVVSAVALGLVGFAYIMDAKPYVPKVLLGFLFMLSLTEQLLRKED